MIELQMRLNKVSEKSEQSSSFWGKVTEAVIVSVLTLIAEAVFRKMGEIDVFGSAVCKAVQYFSDDALRWGC
jgi:hypothetical protein